FPSTKVRGQLDILPQRISVEADFFQIANGAKVAEQRDHLRIDDVQVGLAGHFIDASDSAVESLLQVDRGQGIAPKQLVDRYARRVLRGSGGQYFEDRLFGRGDRRKPSERAVRIKQGPVSRAGCLYRQDFAEH